jgi:hypothetical protein
VLLYNPKHLTVRVFEISAKPMQFTFVFPVSTENRKLMEEALLKMSADVCNVAAQPVELRLLTEVVGPVPGPVQSKQ